MNFIDLFCGCGGFSYGLEQAGHKCLAGFDFDKRAIETFEHNHPHSLAIHKDITKINKKELLSYVGNKKIDMIIGGPPCQGFSTVGKGNVKDERNSLFKHFVRFVAILEPKIIIFENVTGILAKKNEFTLKLIFKEFQRLGFCMDAKVLNACDFGVASSRRRTIIMGVKGGICAFPESKSRALNVRSILNKISKSKTLYNHDLDSTKIKNKLDEKRLAYIPPGHGIRYERDEKQFLPKRLRFDIDWQALPEGRFRQTKLQRLPLDSVAPTILTSRFMYFHPIENRYLTAREAALCQSFPMTFKFFGPVSSQFRQIGNAVPPKLAKAIGEAIKSIKRSKNNALILENELDAKKLGAKAFNYRNKNYA